MKIRENKPERKDPNSHCYGGVFLDMEAKVGANGAKIENYLSKRVTHIFAMNWDALRRKIDPKRLTTFTGVSACSL